MSSETGWCTIESDPAVFSSLIEQLGATGFDVEEVYDLNPAGLAHLGRIFGLIFLFKWTPTKASEVAAQKYLQDQTGVFFARQVQCFMIDIFLID